MFDECPICRRRYRVGLWSHIEACVRRENEVRDVTRRGAGGPILRDRSGSDPAEWPDDLRVQQTPWEAIQ